MMQDFHCSTTEEVICYQLELGKWLVDISTAVVVIKAKLKEVETIAAIYSYAQLRIHIIGGQRSVRIAPPSLW